MKICRTCLQKCHKTYKITESLQFLDSQIKISVVLRFCIPELYLGVSSNPEICSNCREHLKVAYLFKKKCLNSEHIIGNYLKNLRYTGKSIDLEDVFTHLNEPPEAPEVEQARPKAIDNAQDIISDWEEQPEAEGAIENLILEVRQSAPNPTNSVPITSQFKLLEVERDGDPLGKQLRICKEQVPLSDLDKDSYEWTGSNSVRIHKKKLTLILDNLMKKDGQALNKEQPQVVPEKPDDNFLKITSVFSLSDNADKENGDQTTESPAGDAPDGDEPVAEAPDTADAPENSLLEIKDEPLDVEINGEKINFSYAPSDEDTLDASETEDLRCDTSLQGILDSIPEINDSNQYIDVPDFVQINNFGLRDLEELRLQQKREEERKGLPGTQAGAGEGVGVSTKAGGSQPGPIYGLKMVKCQEGGYKVVGEALKTPPTVGAQDSSNSSVTCSDDIFNKLPEVLLVGGRRYVKSYINKDFRLHANEADGAAKKSFAYIEARSPGPFEKKLSIVSPPGKAGSKDNSKAGGADTADKKQPRRRRKRLKIVPVDRFTSLHEKKKGPLKNDDRDIVVLFTNYTYDGYYINDHDYLVNPYKRNKILIETPEEWVCMCYICHTQHPIHTHVKHMSRHGSECKVCKADLGTTYMLNVHVRSHTKPCRLCTEKVPYGLAEKHEQNHLEEEMEFEEMKVKTYSHLRSKKRKVNKDEKSVYFPLPHEEAEKGYNSVSEAENLSAEPSNEASGGSDEVGKAKRKGRKRKYTASGEESSPVEKRVLRSNSKKLNNETDLDVSASESVDEILSTTGPP